MTEYGKAQIQALGAGLIGFVVVVGVGALLIFPHGKASVKAPASSYAPVDVTANLSAPVPVSKSVNAGAPQGEAAPVTSSPAPILPTDDVEETMQSAPAAPAAAAPVAAPAPTAAKTAPAAPAKSLSVTQHLEVRSSANSSAKAVVAAATPVKAPAKKPMIAPKLDLSKTPQGSLASSVHYGVNDRAELMGRAAGPVYNFAGRNVNPKGAPAPDAAPNAAPSGGALNQVDAAQKQIDDSSLSDADKATINATLAKVKQSQAQ